MIYNYCFKYGLNCNDIKTSKMNTTCDRDCSGCAYSERIKIEKSELGGNINGIIQYKK